ncbi:hypothetical protein J6590_025524 [Homalodisca vitripennis]|nr:hypothetical protein J6590_025524 [Homalodisca vitripennis]
MTQDILARNASGTTIQLREALVALRARHHGGNARAGGAHLYHWLGVGGGRGLPPYTTTALILE